MLERPGGLPFLIGPLPHDTLICGLLRRSRMVAARTQPTAVALDFVTSLAWRILKFLVTLASWLGPLGYGFPEWMTGLGARLLLGSLTELRRANRDHGRNGWPKLDVLAHYSLVINGAKARIRHSIGARPWMWDRPAALDPELDRRGIDAGSIWLAMHHPDSTPGAEAARGFGRRATRLHGARRLSAAAA
jgi:hypothetical protein